MENVIKVPGHYYSSDELEFLKNNFLGRTTQQLTDMFNKKFKTDLTQTQIFAKKKALKLKSGVVTRFKKGAGSYPRGVGYQHRFTKKQIEFLKDNVELPNYLLTQKFNSHFNTDLNRRKIISAKERHNIKGAIPYGSKYITGFKKGNVPPSHRTVGSEVVIKDKCGNCYTYVKVKDKQGRENIKVKHRLIWENEHGEIPKGYKVIFADGNQQNFELSNLILVSAGELAIMNAKHLITNDTDLTKIGHTLARLLATTTRKRKILEEK